MADVIFPTSCELVDIDTLIPYDKNPKEHDEKQIDAIIKSIKTTGWGEPILACADTKEILAGHGRLFAAKKMGIPKVPVVWMPAGLTEEQKAHYVIASNKLVEATGYNNYLEELIGNFEFDPADFCIDIKELTDEIDVGKTIVEEIDAFRGLIYTPQGEKPTLDKLIVSDNEKIDSFRKKIDESNVTDEEKEFLLKALNRFYKFNFKNIAEYYCHSSDELKSLFEDLLLVIPDGHKLLRNNLLGLDSMIIGEQGDELDD